jgi:predicted RNA-binding Zn-ribbon protein involved in translation (DUF1610 family)
MVMNSWVFWALFIPFAGSMIFLVLYTIRRNSEIVECGSCGNKMTLRTFKVDGCPACGSDLYRRTHKYAR